MKLGKFRELTKDIPDDVEMLIDAISNPFGNCWTVLTIEATAIGSFGASIPAIKIAQRNPDWIDDDDCEQVFFVHPEYGTWL